MPRGVKYTKMGQPEAGMPIMEITPNTSGNPVEFYEGDALTTRDAADNAKADGSNPTYSVPAFADGKDMRVKG